MVAHPHDQISDLQRRQMTTVTSKRVKTVVFHGGGDDLDQPLKDIRKDEAMQATHPTCGINSYNFGRVLAQTVHYFWSYFQITDSNEEYITFGLPIGAMGNIAAGYLARLLGLRIEKFVGSVNINDITHRAFDKGQFHIEKEMKKNLSEAINIQAPYNFERLLYWASDENWQLVKALYNEFENTGKMDIPSSLLKKLQDLCRTYR